MSNEKAQNADKRASRHNSEPNVEVVDKGANHRMTSLPDQLLGEEGTGIFSRLKTEFIKRVSRVTSEEESETAEPVISPDYDPNLKPLGFHALTLKALETHKISTSSASTSSSERVWKRSPATRRRTECEKQYIIQEKTETNESEVFDVLKDLKERGECSRKGVLKKVVELRRGDKCTLDTQGTQFGLRIVGGKRTAGGMLCAFIASITPGGPAERSGQLLEGELVLEWNGVMLIGLTYEQCQQKLHAKETVTIVTSTFLRGSYRRYRPRSNNSTSGSVESILRGTTNKWISMARKSAQNKQILKALTLSSADVVKELDTSPCLRVELQLMYVAMENRLSVHLIQAANVPVEGGLDGIDLFCKLQLQPEHSTCDSKRRSKTSQRTYSPYWNQHFEFQPIDEGLLSGMKLELSLWSHHWIHKDLLVGQLELDLHQRTVLTGQAGWYKLTLPNPAVEGLAQEERPKSLPDMIKDKVALQHRMTFSTFDQKSKADQNTEIRRSASDSSKPQKPGTPYTDEDNDNVFTTQTLQQQLTNIKGKANKRKPVYKKRSHTEPRLLAPSKLVTCFTSSDSESDPGQKPPIQVRSSPRRRPRVIKPKQPDLTTEAERQKCRRAYRSNSEDYTTKGRVLPKIPNRSRAENSQTLPKRMVSPVFQAERFGAHPQVVLTAPSSEETSTDGSARPNPEGHTQPRSDHSELLGPGQISVGVSNTVQGSLMLTLCIEENMLTIEVVRAKDLPIRASGLAPDTYIKTYILLEQEKSHKEKTSIIKSTSSPEFNETITYIVNPKNKVLQVMVWDVLGALRRNTLLGEVLIDLNYVSTHPPYQGWFKLQRQYVTAQLQAGAT